MYLFGTLWVLMELLERIHVPSCALFIGTYDDIRAMCREVDDYFRDMSRLQV